jgi:hypothetical protein
VFKLAQPTLPYPFSEGCAVDSTYQDCFVVFAVDDSRPAWRPQTAERAVAVCSSHEDAARVRQELRDSGQHCVIRCVSETGGGD